MESQGLNQGIGLGANEDGVNKPVEPVWRHLRDRRWIDWVSWLYNTKSRHRGSEVIFISAHLLRNGSTNSAPSAPVPSDAQWNELVLVGAVRDRSEYFLVQFPLILRRLEEYNDGHNEV